MKKAERRNQSPRIWAKRQSIWWTFKCMKDQAHFCSPTPGRCRSGALGHSVAAGPLPSSVALLGPAVSGRVLWGTGMKERPAREPQVGRALRRTDCWQMYHMSSLHPACIWDLIALCFILCVLLDQRNTKWFFIRNYRREGRWVEKWTRNVPALCKQGLLGTVRTSLWSGI